MRLVFFDLETGGLDPLRHPVTQIAAIAVDEKLNELDSFEAKLHFDLEEADAEALKLNSFDKEVWRKEAVSQLQALDRFSSFLKCYADVPMVSQRTGNPYNVAQLCGYNAATFDGPFLQALYRKQNVFMPACYRVMCLLQRVVWHFHERRDTAPPENFKLETVCSAFGISLDDAHDAMADVRATLELYRRLREVNFRNQVL